MVIRRSSCNSSVPSQASQVAGGGDQSAMRTEAVAGGEDGRE
jgi:hypothetical protein